MFGSSVGWWAGWPLVLGILTGLVVLPEADGAVSVVVKEAQERGRGQSAGLRARSGAPAHGLGGFTLLGAGRSDLNHLDARRFARVIRRWAGATPGRLPELVGIGSTAAPYRLGRERMQEVVAACTFEVPAGQLGGGRD